MTTVSDVMIDCLRAWGVQRVYVHAGRGACGLVGAASRAQGLSVVPAARAELAGLMACAHARFTGGPGICVAGSCPAAVQVVQALQDARLDRCPVVVIVGEERRAFSLASGARRRAARERAIFDATAAAGVTRVTDPFQAGGAIGEAMRAARCRGDVACVIVPAALQGRPAAAKCAGVVEPKPWGGGGESTELSWHGGGGGEEAEGAPAAARAMLRQVSGRLPAGTLVACEWEESGPEPAREGAPGRAGACFGAPHVIAAKFAYPERPVLAVASRRAMQLVGNNGLTAVARHWKQWADPRFVVLVMNAGGPREDGYGTHHAPLAGVSYAAYACSLGLQGVRVEAGDNLAAAVEGALRSNRPALIEALTPAVYAAERSVASASGAPAAVLEEVTIAGAMSRASEMLSPTGA